MKNERTAEIHPNETLTEFTVKYFESNVLVCSKVFLSSVCAEQSYKSWFKTF